jgi:DNA-binding NarL/FixJ family response regulator
MQAAHAIEERSIYEAATVLASAPVRTIEARANGRIGVVIAAPRPDREGLRVLLERDAGIAVVGEAVDGENAVALVRAVSPDVVVIGGDLPGTDGVAATRQIVAGGRTRVIVLADSDTDSRVFAALRAGASMRLLREGAPTQLASAVRRVRHDVARTSVRPRRNRRFASPTVTEIFPVQNAEA